MSQSDAKPAKADEAKAETKAPEVKAPEVKAPEVKPATPQPAKADEAKTVAVANPAGVDVDGASLRKGWGKSFLVEPLGTPPVVLPTLVVTQCCDAVEAKRFYCDAYAPKLNPGRLNLRLTEVAA